MDRCAQQADLSGVDNDTWRIDRARLGALTGIDTGTRGTYYFDAFEFAAAELYRAITQASDPYIKPDVLKENRR